MQQTISQAVHQAGKIPGNSFARGHGIASKENHHREHIRAVTEKVYQDVLIHPVDLSQQPADPITNDGGPRFAPRGEARLNGNVLPRFGHSCFAVEKADAAACYSTDVAPISLEERPDQAPSLQAVGPGKSERPALRVLVGRRGIQIDVTSRFWCR